MKRRMNLLFLMVKIDKSGHGNLGIQGLKVFELKIDKMSTAALAMTERGTEISRFRTVAIIACHLLQLQLFRRSLIAAGQDAEHQEEQGQDGC